MPPVCLDCPMLESGNVASTTSLVLSNVTDEATTWAGDTFNRCFNVTELSNSISLDFELSSLFLLTGVDTRGSVNISGIQVEYGLSADSLTTYYDDRLSTSVSRISCHVLPYTHRQPAIPELMLLSTETCIPNRLN